MTPDVIDEGGVGLMANGGKLTLGPLMTVVIEELQRPALRHRAHPSHLRLVVSNGKVVKPRRAIRTNRRR